MIPKLLHKAIKDLLSLEKKIFEGEEGEMIHDEADRLDVEFEGFASEQIKEGFALYNCGRAFSRQQPKEVEVRRKTIEEKFLSGESLSF